MEFVTVVNDDELRGLRCCDTEDGLLASPCKMDYFALTYPLDGVVGEGEGVSSPGL